VAEYIYGAAGTPARQRQLTGRRPLPPRGTVSVGRVAKLFIGQCFGFIRLVNEREIYFHRSDMREGISINDLRVGDSVTFELLEDRISGPRALHVAPRRAIR
jgi:cold shock CspA family protein